MPAPILASGTARPSPFLRWHTLCSADGQARRGKGSDKTMDLTTIVTWIIFGAIVGVIARFLMPGRDPMGWPATIVLGIVGSFVGGYLAQILFAGNASLPPPSAGWLGSIVGAIIVLAVYRYSQGRRVAV
jgi:uncharacterized membrane protein YeaQ/YmgE (transglycosylase-associated protein family)